MKPVLYHLFPSPIGRLLLVSDGDDALTGLYMDDHHGGLQVQSGWRNDPRRFDRACDQLTAYFDGAMRRFDVPLAPEGTEFQKKVWHGLEQIPFGETISYGELARRIGQPNASRAVGRANGQNPISIIVPCHRVIGADGALTGYGGGIDRKKWLLEHEAAAEHSIAARAAGGSVSLSPGLTP